MTGSGRSTIRIATVNVASGRDADGVVRMGRAAGAVADLGADVVAVQEVDHLLSRSGGVDQTAVFAEACAQGGPRWARHFAAALHGSPGRAGAARAAQQTLAGEPSYGVALLSRFPVLRWDELRLAPARGRRPLMLPAGTNPPIGLIRDEQRVALAAVVSTPHGLLTVITTHLSFAPLRAATQLRRVQRWASRLPRPLLLLGDLNLPGGLPSRLTGWDSLARAHTFPAHRPRLQLDHVLGDAIGWPVDSRQAVAVGGSDHLALVVSLRMDR